MYFWISWYQPTDDYRPLKFPANSAVLGYWSTGDEYVDGKFKSSTMCAMVKAPTEEAAKTAVLIDWPEAERWRFCEPKTDTKLSDRFPLTDWMTELKLLEAQTKNLDPFAVH